MRNTRIVSGAVMLLLVLAFCATTAPSDDTLEPIRDEGLNRSQAMEMLLYLTDLIGPRLSGSPAMRRANDWCG